MSIHSDTLSLFQAKQSLLYSLILLLIGEVTNANFIVFGLLLLYTIFI